MVFIITIKNKQGQDLNKVGMQINGIVGIEMKFKNIWGKKGTPNH